MKSKTTRLASSGYSPLDYLSSPIFIDGFLTQYFPTSVAPNITTSLVDTTKVRFNKQYVFKDAPRATIFDARGNADIPFDSLDVTTRDMYIGRAMGAALKVDIEDQEQIDNFPTYINAWKASVQEELARHIDKNLLQSMVLGAAQCNKGGAAIAGAMRLDRGKPTAPLVINAQSITSSFQHAALILDSQNAPTTDRFIVLPSAARIALENSGLLSNMSVSGAKPLVLGGTIPDIAGFTVYFSQMMPAYKDTSGALCYPIIAGHKSSTYFAMGAQDWRMNETEARHWGSMYKGRFAFDWKVVRPEFLTIAYVTVQI